MSYPEAIVIVAVLIAGCFERYLRFRQFSFEDRLKIQDVAIKNIAVQSIDEISKLKDRVATLAIAVGIKSKEPK